MLATLYRRGLLSIADSKLVSQFIRQQGWKLGVGRFVAGETLADAITAVSKLEQQGLKGILDLLGEFVSSEAGVTNMIDEILAALKVLAGQSFDKHMSVKPTQLGLGLDFKLALANAQRIAVAAKDAGVQICFDMENSPHVDGTLKLYRALSQEGLDNVSTVLQSYLYRSMDDLTALLKDDPKLTLRITKGAYRESAAGAFQKKADVDANFREMVFAGLDAGAKINVASHDERLITEIEAYLRGAKLEPQHYEFQLLYGVKPSLQKRLQGRGHPVRIYIPYGKDWYGYFSRRLAERPANLAFVLRGLLD